MQFQNLQTVSLETGRTLVPIPALMRTPTTVVIITVAAITTRQT